MTATATVAQTGTVAVTATATATATVAVADPGPVLVLAIEETCTIIAMARPLVQAIQRHDRELGAQLRRALGSIALNAAEGLGSRAGNARNRFETAHGSLFEVRAAFCVAVAWGYISEAQIAEICRRIHALGGRMDGLMRR